MITDTSLADELRRKAIINRERIQKQSEAQREKDIKQGFDVLLKRIHELAEKGYFSHIFRADIEACTAYMHSLRSLGFSVELEHYRDPFGPSEVNKIRISWE